MQKYIVQPRNKGAFIICIPHLPVSAGKMEERPPESKDTFWHRDGEADGMEIFSDGSNTHVAGTCILH